MKLILRRVQKHICLKKTAYKNGLYVQVPPLWPIYWGILDDFINLKNRHPHRMPFLRIE